ncbi:diacylglycerol kinase (ATP) [Paragonimus westermani]|uniref:Diacylglycerol kinase n=1 Tax=Paragonimus westermani TaxID=34504 RepID=A0A5J4NT25_9TREM|nr:diacylglycerol kinase (ATP) [Paragonimus westermani]
MVVPVSFGKNLVPLFNPLHTPVTNGLNTHQAFKSHRPAHHLTAFPLWKDIHSYVGIFTNRPAVIIVVRLYGEYSAPGFNVKSATYSRMKGAIYLSIHHVSPWHPSWFNLPLPTVGQIRFISNGSSAMYAGSGSKTVCLCVAKVCEYYCHTECQDYAVNDCKRGATYQPDKPVAPPRQTHHWREGNLPTNSKCAHCRKTCWSSECLTGYRCQWCGLTAHAACISLLADACDFGPLRNIMLPSQCVSLPRSTIPIEYIIGVTKRPRSRAISEDWSSSGDSKEDSWQDRRSPKETIDRASSEEYVCVFDGMGGLKSRIWRSFSFSKTMSTYSAIKRCLKTFHLAGTPDNFNVYEVNDRDGRENKLNVNANFRSQLRFDLKQPSILLRAKEPQESQITVRVYAGDLGHILPPNAALYEEVLVDASMTSIDVVNKAMEKFGSDSLSHCTFQHLASDDCYLTSVCMDGTVTERHLADDELLVTFLRELRQESARVYQLTRLELRFVEDSLSTNRLVSVFVGNLKENLSQRLYECILLEKLGEECRWDTIDAIYYESGCLVLTYRSSEKAERAYDLLKDSVLMDKQLTALLLPTIHPKLIPPDVQPLLVFVNLKSGGCQGMDLIVAFRRLLNPFQVFNLDYGGPLPGLYCFRHLTSYKILICGGDGTVGWTLSCLDIVGQDAACNSPPIAPLPLGTGNDLARVLRWGSGYSSAEDPLAILKDVVAAEEVQLDRWTFVVRPDEEFKDEAKLALENQNNASNTNEDNSIMIIMNNYFGIGIDADLSLDFHNARSENPSKFNSRIHNKGVYFKIGLRKMINRTACKDLHKQIVVVADGKLLLLPPIEGLIVLNIHSWGGGANPWGVEKDDVFVKPTHYDGLLEVVGISGVVHMGQIYSGLGTGIRLTQAGHLKILLKTELPIQIDGEPFIHPAGQIVVLRSALRATMLRKVKRIKRRTMEITLPAEAGRLTTQQSMQPDTLETTTNIDRPSSSSPLSTPPVGTASSGSFALFDPNWSPCQTASSEGGQRGKSEKSTAAPSRGNNSSYPMAGDSLVQPGNEKMSDTPLLPPCLLTGDDGVEAPILHSLSLKSSNGSGIPSGSKSM